MAPDLPPPDAQRVLKVIEDLLAQRETNAQRAAAETLLQVYGGFDADGRRRFLELLATQLGADPEALDRAAEQLRVATPGTARVKAERELRAAVIPRYATVFHVVTGLPLGVRFLVELRADLLTLRSRDSALGLLDDELTGHLSTLFDVGLLELRQITWDSPASVLERLIATEAVHEIHGWDDLQRRLAGDRRGYAFFHPALPNEPIVFVETAVTHGLATKLSDLLEGDAAVDDVDTAIFYSITSCQPGLAGVHLGNELIKQVIDELRRDVDDLKTFATLSPLPGFRAWIAARGRGRHPHPGGTGVARRRRPAHRHAHRSLLAPRPGGERPDPARPAVGRARATSRPRVTVGRSTRSGTSTCRTARRWSASTGSPTSRATGSSSRSA